MPLRSSTYPHTYELDFTVALHQNSTTARFPSPRRQLYGRATHVNAVAPPILTRRRIEPFTVGPHRTDPAI